MPGTEPTAPKIADSLARFRANMRIKPPNARTLAATIANPGCTRSASCVRPARQRQVGEAEHVVTDRAALSTRFYLRWKRHVRRKDDHGRQRAECQANSSGSPEGAESPPEAMIRNEPPQQGHAGGVFDGVAGAPRAKHRRPPRDCPEPRRSDARPTTPPASDRASIASGSEARSEAQARADQ
jgi:hypothetical protein